MVPTIISAFATLITLFHQKVQYVTVALQPDNVTCGIKIACNHRRAAVTVLACYRTGNVVAADDELQWFMILCCYGLLKLGIYPADKISLALIIITM